MMHTALIIDDEADIRELLGMSLERIGIDTHTASNLEEARNLLSCYEFDVCLTDMRLPDGNGVDFVSEMAISHPNLPVAVITAHGNMNAAVDAMKNGAFDFVSKPVDINLLRKLVEQAVALREQISETPDHANYPQSTLKASSNDPHFQNYVDESDEAGESDTVEYRSSQLASNLIEESAEKRQGDARPSAHSSTPTRESGSRDQALAGGEQLIGSSRASNEIRQMILKVSRTNAPVWITGESGSGKELIARLIHLNSPRAGKPFVGINCGAIPGELMESEMFGHVKGSFTGALRDHDGFFIQADGGTLFLDEVADLPLNLQTKLLRAVQERMVRPVGAKREIPTDVRILSASHKDLSAELDRGNFRHDLYYRLNVIKIHSPALSERIEDIRPIAEHIIDRICHRQGVSRTITLGEDALGKLENYPFPGNIRELENLLERAITLSDSDALRADDIHLGNTTAYATYQTGKTEEGEAPTVDSTDIDEMNSNTQTRFDSSALASVISLNSRNRPSSTGDVQRSSERELILAALERNRWNRKYTARELGLTYRQLRYRIAQFGIDDTSR